ncbi:hypothetical protein COCNU_11G004000 [Cocos nucifera]|uniref:MADS-box domain-containing protein n=1 Tax=Cocos nucifera TaxID=13894 RepID=A0A8K0IP99_COCNU|nr:hypothetical protein COCNU_11G004000 [Cocos nucifera]
MLVSASAEAYELATLCDVELALVCYPSDDAEPTTWPPDRSKIEESIHRYLVTPAHKKIPKNQITLNNPNPGADGKKEAAEAAAAKAAEEADWLRIPFPDDEDKLIAVGGILESRLKAVRKMIAVRRTEGRRDPRPSAGYPAKKLPVAAASASGGDPKPSAGDPPEKLARGQGGPPPPAAAVVAESACRTDPRTSDRDRRKRVARDYGPVWGSGHPNFSAASMATGRGAGRVPNFWYPCPCCYCPIHSHLLLGWNGR